MARRSAEYNIDGLVAYPRRSANVRASHGLNGVRDDGTIWKVELVGRAMNGVDLDCGNIEAGLLEAKTYTAGSGEKIDPDGSSHTNFSLSAGQELT